MTELQGLVQLVPQIGVAVVIVMVALRVSREMRAGAEGLVMRVQDLEEKVAKVDAKLDFVMAAVAPTARPPTYRHTPKVLPPAPGE